MAISIKGSSIEGLPSKEGIQFLGITGGEYYLVYGLKKDSYKVYGGKKKNLIPKQVHTRTFHRDGRVSIKFLETRRKNYILSFTPNSNEEGSLRAFENSTLLKRII